MPGLPDIPVGIETTANADMRDAYAAISTGQDSHIFGGGTRYLQCLKTSAAPVDGATSVPDFSLKPAYQATSLSDESVSLTARVISFEVHQTYLHDRLGVETIDWILYGRIEIGGKVYVGIGNPSHGDGAGTPDLWQEEE